MICEHCEATGRPVVPGEGPDRADLVIVGEAPGEEEVRQGRPFVGQAGQLLDRILEREGIKRGECYITNAVLYHPRNNKTPTAADVAGCRDRLIAEIKARQPKRVLALGAVAAKNLLQTREGISKLRIGEPIYSEELGCDIIPTFHPAAALRDPDKVPSIIYDISKATRAKVVWEPTKFKVADEENVDDLIRESYGTGIQSVDIEVAPPFNRHDPNWLSIAISHRPGYANVYPRELVNRLDFGLIGAKYVYQNGKYDTQRIWSSISGNARVDEDTMLMHYITDERKGTHGLEAIASEIIGAPNWKSDFYREIGTETPTVEEYEKNRDICHRYNATDADVTLRLLNPLTEKMRREGVEDVYRNLLIPGANALAQVEYQGVKIDRPYLDEMTVTLGEEKDELYSKCQKWLDNPNSWQQIKAALLEDGIKVPNTQAETLKEVDHPLARALVEYKKVHTILSTFVMGLQNHIVDGRIYPNYNLHVAESGRTSSSEPNLQNIPIDHPVREAIVADSEDDVLLDIDYKNIELRLAAILSGDDAMIAMLRDNVEFFNVLATEIFGPNYGPRDYVDTKSVVYGALYGETEYGVAKRIGGDTDRAKEIQVGLFTQYPGLLQMRRKIENEVRVNSCVVSPFGRKRRFWLITPRNRDGLLREAYNFPLQSTASDITLTALIRCVENGIIPRLTVHDDLIFNVPKAEVEDYTREIRGIMEEANPFDIPIPTDVTFDYRWRMKE